jgi:hypothetical protein
MDGTIPWCGREAHDDRHILLSAFSQTKAIQRAPVKLELYLRQTCALLCISHRAVRADTYDALRALGEAALKSFRPIAAALMLVASGWTVSAETAEDRQACIGDAFRVCWSAIPDRNNVLQCLVENRSQLNPSCREVITRYTRSHRHKATRSAHSGRSQAE